MRNRARLRPGLLVAGWALVGALFAGELVVGVLLHTQDTPRTGTAHPAGTASTRDTGTPSAVPPSATAPTPTPKPARTKEPNPFAGTTVGIDPGHNGRNYTDTAFINQRIFNGRSQEACNTTGTSTNGGYAEARFTFAVAGYLAAYLRAQGARVVLTRTTNDGVGPCVDKRAQIINNSRAAVAIDIHGNGEPAGVRGFSLLVPVADGPNGRVIAASRRYAGLLRTAFAKTGMPVQGSGIVPRTDLAGLNLTTVPQVLIECGNMRNATDAAMMTSPAFQRRAARAIMAAMGEFLRGRNG